MLYTKVCSTYNYAVAVPYNVLCTLYYMLNVLLVSLYGYMRNQTDKIHMYFIYLYIIIVYIIVP